MRVARILAAGGLVGQAALLIPIAGLNGASGGAALAAGTLAAGAALSAWRRTPGGGRSWLLMLSLGGLGMTLGWWADLGFGSAAALLRAAPEALASGAWCGLGPLEPGAHAVPGRHLASWMNAGMLAASGAAMGLAPAVAGARCSLGEFLREGLAMLIGMNAGAWLAAGAGAALSVEVAVVAAHGLMLGGMLAGAGLARVLASSARGTGWVRADGIRQTHA